MTTRTSNEILVNMATENVEQESCLPYCCGCFGVTALIGAIISWFVFGILFLVKDYDVWHECKNDSELWVYVLILLILSFSKKNYKDASDAEKVSAVVCSLCIEIALAIWGTIEIYDKSMASCCPNLPSNSTLSCIELTSTDLWTYAAVSNGITWGVTLIMCCVMSCLLYCGIEREPVRSIDV